MYGMIAALLLCAGAQPDDEISVLRRENAQIKAELAQVHAKQAENAIKAAKVDQIEAKVYAPPVPLSERWETYLIGLGGAGTAGFAGWVRKAMRMLWAAIQRLQSINRASAILIDQLNEVRAALDHAAAQQPISPEEIARVFSIGAVAFHKIAEAAENIIDVTEGRSR